jgi:hypothetical protein
MAPPHSAASFEGDIYVFDSSDRTLCLSDSLADLLYSARQHYSWPNGQTAQVSQDRVISLERTIREWMQDLTPDKAVRIVEKVSEWGGSRAGALSLIRSSTAHQALGLAKLVGGLSVPDRMSSVLRSLSEQPGIGLVMATKIFRFCAPGVGAAVDRHCSYFFNSLPDKRMATASPRCADFRREWADGKHKTTRLATYYDSGLVRNLIEYSTSYLPLLAAMADSLNKMRGGFLCAATRTNKYWRPTDVEMAAYYWWAHNGADELC